MKNDFDEIIKIYVHEEQESILKDLIERISYSIRSSNNDRFESIDEKLYEIKSNQTENFEAIKQEIFTKWKDFEEKQGMIKNYIDLKHADIIQNLEDTKKEIITQTFKIAENFREEVNKINDTYEQIIIEIQKMREKNIHMSKDFMEMLSEHSKEIKKLENEMKELLNRIEFRLQEMDIPWYKKIYLFFKKRRK